MAVCQPNGYVPTQIIITQLSPIVKTELNLQQISKQFYSFNCLCGACFVILLIIRSIILFDQDNDAYGAAIFYIISDILFIFTVAIGTYGVVHKKELILCLYYQLGLLLTGAFELVGTIIAFLYSSEAQDKRSKKPYSFIIFLIMMVIVIVILFFLQRQSKRIRELIIELRALTNQEQQQNQYQQEHEQELEQHIIHEPILEEK